MSTRFIFIETDDPQAVATALSALGISIGPAAAPAALPIASPPPAQLPGPAAAIVSKTADAERARGERLLKRAKASIRRVTSDPPIITGKSSVSPPKPHADSGYECNQCGGDCPPDHDRRAGCPKCNAGRGCWTPKPPPRKEL